MDIISYLLGKKNSGGGSSGLDWKVLGFSDIPRSIQVDYAYSKSIQDNWTPSPNVSQKFRNNSDIVYMPTVDTSSAQMANQMFQYCGNLKSVAPLDFSNCTNFREMFASCTNLRDLPILDLSNAGYEMLNSFIKGCHLLTEQSLDNILQMCANIPNYTGTKTFRTLILDEFYTVEKLQSLPHYQDFINAGWTIGY